MASAFVGGGHIRYIGDAGEVTKASFLTPAACHAIVTICEAHAAAHGGWSVESAEKYAQTTVDLEVDRVPQLRAWLLEHNFIDQVDAHYQQANAAKLCALDDLFVVKYEAGGQTELRWHTDAGEVSFMVALSESGIDFEAGGTTFETISKTVQCRQGEILSFDAKLFHAGVPITKGVRYLLVGFGWVNEAAARERGNLSLDLVMI